MYHTGMKRNVSMTNDYCIKNRIYDSRLYDNLTKEYWQKEMPKEIKDYCTYCYHYEEYRAGLL